MQKSVCLFAIVTLFVVSNLTKRHLSERLRADASIDPYIHAAAIKRRANHVRPCSAKGFRLFLLFRGVGVVFYVQQSLGGSYFLGSGHAHAVQRVRDTQVLPLEKPQCVVRQNLDAAHGGQ